jgi:hypothetical protein
MYTLTVQPYYDKNSQNYINIIRINMIPEGPLRLFVRRLNQQPLSIFQKNNNNNYAINSCIFALISLSGNGYMNPNEIPNLFSFLTTNGYKIDTSITKMMNTSEIRLENQNILCFFSYLNNKN